MSDKWARIFAGVAVIGLGWVVVYWWMSPSPPKISFDAAGPSAARANAIPPPQPKSKPELADIRKPQPKTQPGTPRVSIDSPITATPVAQPKQPATPPSGPSLSPIQKPMVTPPQFSDYRIKSGDTLDSIATIELGSARHATAIRRSNPFKDLDKLKAGDTIRIPLDPTNIQGKPVPKAPQPTAPVEQQEATVEYTVQAGDTLSKIAKDQYGNVSFKDLIYSANKDRLKSGGDSLKVGQKLRLPPKPKS